MSHKRELSGRRTEKLLDFLNVQVVSKFQTFIFFYFSTSYIDLERQNKTYLL